MSNHYDFYREPNDPSDEEIEEFVKLFQEAVKDVPFYEIEVETIPGIWNWFWEEPEA